MATSYLTPAQNLIARGYPVTPIKRGDKSPLLSDWVNRPVTNFDKYANCGVGVMCGQGDYPVCALDVDSTDSELVTRFVAWCNAELGVTCERVGNAPKTLLVYRANGAGWRKQASNWFDDIVGDSHRLEVLGRGQQFVAYAIHPDTKKPYEWVDSLGGLVAVSAQDLPVLTFEQMQTAVMNFEQMAVDAGMSACTKASATAPAVRDDDDSNFIPEPKLGLTLTEAGELITHLDNTSYDSWLKVGMALHHEFDGSTKALELWDSWSSTAPNYDADVINQKWYSFSEQTSRYPVTARSLVKFGKEANAQAERDSKRQVLDEIRQLIDDCDDSVDLLALTATAVSKLIDHGDMGQTAQAVALLQQRFKALTKVNLGKKEAQLALKIKTADTSFAALTHGAQLTEFGNASKMLERYGDNIMYVAETDQWYKWDGVHWRRASHVEIEQLAKDSIMLMLDEYKNGSQAQDIFEFVKNSMKAQVVKNIVTLVRSDEQVLTPFVSLDSDKNLLGCANGVIDLDTGVLLPPEQGYRITAISPVEYDIDATCPLWQQTLLEIFNEDKSLIDFFKRLMGYTLLAQPDEDFIVIPYGCGSNGKSTLLTTLAAVFGDHAVTADPATFMGSGKNAGGSPREDVLRLRGKRLCYVGEPDDNSELKESLVKSMTGGEAIAARGAYARHTVEVIPTWVAFMATNHKPIIKGDDHGIWRRILPIPFTRNFDSDPAIVKDKDRPAKLKAEYSGILRWCVEGAIAYRKQGLQIPDSVKQARAEYKGDMDLLAEWLDTCCEASPVLGGSEDPKKWATLTSQLWASWSEYARANGTINYVRSSNALSRRLSSRGFRQFKNEFGLRGRGFIGLRLTASVDFAD